MFIRKYKCREKFCLKNNIITDKTQTPFLLSLKESRDQENPIKVKNYLKILKEIGKPKVDIQVPSKTIKKGFEFYQL